ncbi:hypothetical protein V5O48_013184 [Marasmius crinis-equi]|uniref:Uncharacterized protein n=1 Tax=Marasmius crinis-equi TaxID=585013 RepID=A0ABR3F0S5_9AGAR
MALSLQGSFFLSLWIEAMVYGVYFCLFVIDFALAFSRRRKRENRYGFVFWLTSVMFLVATLHVILAGIRLMKYGVPMSIPIIIPVSSDGQPFKLPEGGGLFTLAGSWENLAYNTLYPVQEILGSVAVVHRSWVLWNKNWKIIAIPLLLLVTAIVLGSVTAALLARLDIMAAALPTSVFDLTISFYAVTLFLNILSTCLMIYPLWSSYRHQVLPRRSSIVRPVLWILVESAALQIILEAWVIGLFVTQHATLNILVSAIPPAVGITFSLITTRVKLVWLSRDAVITEVNLPTLPTFNTHTMDTSLSENSRRDVETPSVSMPLQRMKSDSVSR